MIKNIKFILLVFFIGGLFQAIAGRSKEQSSPSVRQKKLKENPKQLEKLSGFEAKKKSAEFKAKGKSKSPFVSSKKRDLKNKRKVAGMAYQCSEIWTDEFSFGYIQVGSKCDSDENLCLAHFYIARNYCEEGSLVRHYCDPKQPSLYSTEKIPCEKSCEFSGLSGLCIK